MSKLIETSYSNYKEIVQFLLQSDQISLMSLADENLKKNLILGSASYFENEITSILTKYFHTKNKDSICIKEFLVNKGLKRQYHTLFNWEGKNANSFFSLFGLEFKSFMEKKVKLDKDLEMSIKNFLELGNERNRLVHQNFAQFSIEKTLEEIFSLYTGSLLFVNSITNYLEEFHSSYMVDLENED